MSEKMLVTQALDERDLLVKKINDKIQKASFVDTIKPNVELVYNKRIKKEEFNRAASSAYQQIMDLIARFQTIDAAIINSNANTKITTSYGTYTVAAAISLRSRMRNMGAYDNEANFEDRLRNKLMQEYSSRVCVCDKENAKLKETAEKLFAADNLMVGYTADEEGYKALPEELKKFKAALSDKPSRRYAFEFVPELKNEGFKTSSKVNYVARCGSFDAEAYTGALEVLKVIMNYEYLWQNLRVIGGAYGCMSNFGRSGTGCLVSYRDPKLATTDKIYEGIPEYLKNFSIDERDMTKYVIGAMSSVDTPLSPAVKGSRNLTAYLSGITDEMVQKKREQILDVTQEDIRALADILESILKTGAFCVIGNEQQIEADKNMFKEVKELFH